jgi:hypothetical protein
MITLSLEEKVMLHKYKVLSFAIVAALYIFLVPSTSHAQEHVPNTLAGDPVCGEGGRGMAGWTLGCDRISHKGAHPGDLRRFCERSYNAAYHEGAPPYDIIQATGGYCYYYKAGTSSGRGGPNMWYYGNAQHAINDEQLEADERRKERGRKEMGRFTSSPYMVKCGHLRRGGGFEECIKKLGVNQGHWKTCLATDDC